MHGNVLLDALPVAVYTTDAAGRITYYNQAAVDLWGCRPEIGTAQWCGSWRLYRPDGRPLPHDECPMALTLKQGRPVRGVEAVAERPDGTRIRFAAYPTPLFDADGRLTGAINLLMDLTERYDADIAAARLGAIVASSDDAIVGKTLTGRITSWNDAAARLFGYTADEMIGAPITTIIPPELHAEEAEIIAKLRRGERIDHYETERVAKDGRRIDISLSVSPLFDRLGNVIGASKIARDITERRRAAKLQRLLVEELNHRVKNTLAMVQAIASQSMRHADSPASFVTGFGGRIQALAGAHDLLMATRMQGAEIMDLMRQQVLIGGAAEDRVACAGPGLVLDAQTTVHLGLVLHELATNARKYGALATPEGRLHVDWEIRTNGTRELVLHWKESGNRKPAAPRKRGFGSTLVEQTMKTLGGEASLQYGADGLSGRFTLPLPTEARPAIGTLPLATPGDQPALFERPAQRDLKGRRLILIEDEPLVTMDIEASLAAAGCEVVGTSGRLPDAKELAATAQCDGALLDVNLGGAPVDEVAAALTRRNIPFAFVTGYGRDALPAAFRDAPTLKKPFGQQDLVAVVELLMGQAADVVPLRRKQL
jgi:PAS domain S-box-containing protein